LAEAGGAARDEWVPPVGLDPNGLRGALAGRAAPLRAAVLRLRPGERPGSVLALALGSLRPVALARELPTREDGHRAVLHDRSVSGAEVVAGVPDDRLGPEPPVMHRVQE